MDASSRRVARQCRRAPERGGAVAYLTLNLALEEGKASQAPTDLPKGTRTLRATRGYWSRPIAELEAEAKDHNRRRRLAWYFRQQGYPVTAVALAVASAIEARNETTSEIWKYERSPGGVLIPIGPLEKLRVDASSRRLREGQSDDG